ncbi:HD-GYP domain-containing protein [Limnochorda pilosa]|uniref:HD-GYP domain-containing protein n=1 Tax=Limnochorda pilosa TaxID=1555112 RepID=UPI00130DEC2A|nr:HD domain-containing phosphohydrolase [Limnochorda pilosa]
MLLQRAGESLEVAGRSVQYHLLASWDGTEVIRQFVPQGKWFGLRPEEGWTALETLHIISGEAVWEGAHQRVVLRAGDSLTGRPVQEPCSLRAVSDVTAIYVSSLPVFHLISNEVARLRELAVAVETKDGYTREHCARIQSLSARVGQLMNLSPTEQHYLLYGAFLHDLGKVRVPDAILKKPGALTENEWAVMKQHTIFGREMLARTPLAGAAPILEQHHERLDGSGYPYGLKGDAIRLDAQIVAVADSYDAMTTERIYHPAMSHEEAVAELQREAGRLYRTDVVQAFLEVVSGLEPEIKRKGD